MPTADHYLVNQEPLPAEAALTLDSELEVEATIASLKQHFETVRQREVKRVRGRLGPLSSTQENAIDSLTRNIMEGNNNAYCQDNEISWFDWSLVERHAGHPEPQAPLVTKARSCPFAVVFTIMC